MENIKKCISNYVYHVHTKFTGHESLDVKDIVDYVENTGNYVVVTNHFYNNDMLGYYAGKDVRENTLNELKALDKVIVGGEFNVQNFSEFSSNKEGKELLKGLDVIMLSFHTTYSYFGGETIDLGRDTMDNLLVKFRSAVASYNGVKVLGHLDRDIHKCLTECNTKYDREVFRDKVLDICKEYGIIVEINLDTRTSNKKKLALYEKAKSKGLKVILGIDAHSKVDLYKELDNDLLNNISVVDRVNLEDILNSNSILGLIKTTEYIWDYYKEYKECGIAINRYLRREAKNRGLSLVEFKYKVFSELLELGINYGISYNKLYKFTGIDYQVVYQYARKMRSEGIDLYDKYIDKGKDNRSKLIEKNKDKYALFNKAIQELVDDNTKTLKEVCIKYGLNQNIVCTYISRELYIVDNNLYNMYKKR